MAYCTIKTMSQTRGKAMRMLILERQSIQKVADKYGVSSYYNLALETKMAGAE